MAKRRERERVGPLVGSHWWMARGLRSKVVYLSDREREALDAFVRDHRYEADSALGGLGRRGLTLQRLLRTVIVDFLKKEGYLPRRHGVDGKGKSVK